MSIGLTLVLLALPVFAVVAWALPSMMQEPPEEHDPVTRYEDESSE